MAGGVAQGRSLKAVLFGGAAGAFATAAHLDVKLTFEDLRAAGLPLGSGVVMVLDDRREMGDVLSRLGHFFAHESCGKCYPCQMGTQRQKEILDRIAAGKPLADDVRRLEDVGWTMTDASLCGLGQTAATAVLSAIKLWPELFVAKGASEASLDLIAGASSRAQRATPAAKERLERPGRPAKRPTAARPGTGNHTRQQAADERAKRKPKTPPKRSNKARK
jgi:hypothetical protein